MKRSSLFIALFLAALIAGCNGKVDPTISAVTESPKVDPFELDFGDRSIFRSNLVNGEQGILDA